MVLILKQVILKLLVCNRSVFLCHMMEIYCVSDICCSTLHLRNFSLSSAKREINARFHVLSF
jgi:hypothetical protein